MYLYYIIYTISTGNQGVCVLFVQKSHFSLNE